MLINSWRSTSRHLVWGVLVLLAACTSVTPPSDKLPPAEVPAAEGPLVVPPISALPDTPARALSAKYTQVSWSDLRLRVRACQST